MFEWVTTVDGWLTLATLGFMEVVLGIDNLVFLAVLTQRLPQQTQASARRIGLMLALGLRLVLLFSISWIMQLRAELFELFGHGFSGRDLVLFGGGLFLLTKATHEIYVDVEAPEENVRKPRPGASYGMTLVQIAVLDLVFSLDSVITAIGLAEHISAMVVAMVFAMVVMYAFARPVSSFIEKHPSMKILALAFLLLIGVVLMVDGLGKHIEKGYIYFAMGFSLLVQLLQLRRHAQRSVA